MHVLIVDDNRSAADTLALFFKLEGFDARTAYDGQAAVEAVQKESFHLVLMDLGMPKLDGCEAARQICALDLDPHPTLVALSGWSDADHLQQSQDAGFVQHLVKPIEPNDLRKMLEELRLK